MKYQISKEVYLHGGGTTDAVAKPVEVIEAESPHAAMTAFAARLGFRPLPILSSMYAVGSATYYVEPA